jgi:hypothetical protein
MTITQLIIELENLQAKHGDLPVRFTERDPECNGGDVETEVEEAWFASVKTEPHVHLS